MGQLQVFTGTAHPALAQARANQLGLPLGMALVTEYKNGETRVCIEENVRALEIVLSENDLRRIDTAAPKGATAGDRYPEGGMRTING